MKRLIYTFILLFYVSAISAQTPALYGVNHSGEQVTTTYAMGNWTACESVGFVSPFVSFPNESFARREWYYNNTLVGTTYSANQTSFFYPIKNEGTANTVYCKYITTNNSGATVTRNTNQITISGNPVGVDVNIQSQAAYGCSNPITLNIREYSEEVIGVKIEAPRVPYTVSWQLPAGWTIQSATAGNKTIVVIPDKYTGGTVTATVTLDCGYVVKVTGSLSRPVPAAPEFVNFQASVCAAGTTRYTVNPICGASSYTFTIQNNLVPFSNGLTTITTTEPYCDVTYSGASSVATDLSVKADFSNNTSTATTTKSIAFGAPKLPGAIDITYPGGLWRVRATLAAAVPGANRYNWYVDGESWGSSTTLSREFILENCGGTYTIEIEAVNACGVSQRSAKKFVMSCPGMFAVSPNPVSNTLRIVMEEANVVQAKTAAEDIIFNLYSLNGTALLKTWKVKQGQREYQFEVAGVPKGQYVLQAVSRAGKVSKQVVIK